MITNRNIVARMVAPAVFAAAFAWVSCGVVSGLVHATHRSGATLAEPRDASSGQPTGKRTHPPIMMRQASGRLVIFLVPPKEI